MVLGPLLVCLPLEPRGFVVDFGLLGGVIAGSWVVLANSASPDHALLPFKSLILQDASSLVLPPPLPRWLA